MVRVWAQTPGTQEALSSGKQMLLRVMESAPDAFVVTDPTGRVLSANHAFLDLVQLPSEEMVRNASLEKWLGRTGVDMNVLISNLRQSGAVRLFATTLRGEHGSTAQVEISAVSVTGGELPCLGFTIRDVGRRLGNDPRASRDLPRSPGQITELVGRVPLRDIVRETTDLIEQLCIEAALGLTHDNRASAAEMLGLSRQSLYVKLRRFGIGDALAEGEH
jgi:transcriptional regulator PpsR